MVNYVKEMNKYEPAFTYNGVASQGWQSAALLTEAIRQAGNNLAQANIINITNQFTANTSGGLSTVTKWVNCAHHDHLSSVQRYRPGARDEIRRVHRQGQPGLRLPQPEREQPCAGFAAGRYTRNLARGRLTFCPSGAPNPDQNLLRTGGSCPKVEAMV